MIERNQKENIKSIIYDNWAWIIVGVFFLIVGIYLAIYGQDIYIQVHDNLDSNIAALKMLKDKGLFWEHGVKLPFLGGVHDRNYLYSEFKLYSLLYYIFPVFPAYILGCFLRMVISIIGYLVLLKCICKEEKRYRNLAILSGFLYGILPVFPTAGLSFAAVPLYFALLIQIYKKPSWKWYVLLFLCTSLTDFILFGIFGCGWLLLFCIIDGIRHRKIPWNMFLALVAVR